MDDFETAFLNQRDRAQMPNVSVPKQNVYQRPYAHPPQEQGLDYQQAQMETEFQTRHGVQLTTDMLPFDQNFVAASKGMYNHFEGEPFTGSDQEAAEYGVELMGEFYFNFAGVPATGSQGTLYQATSIIAAGDGKKAQDFIYLMDQYERLPTFGEGAFSRMFRNMLKDPSNWAAAATLGTGKILTAGGQQATKMTARQSLRQLAGQAMIDVTTEVAKRPGTYGAIFEGTRSAAEEQMLTKTERAAGYQVSPLEEGVRTTVAGTIGAAAGSTLAKLGETVFGGVAEGAPEAISKAVTDYVGGAEGRMAERAGSVQLGAGVDVPAAIDKAIVGIKNLINKTDEARAAYNAAPNDLTLKNKYLELRRQRDEQMSALPDDVELQVEADYRMQHQPRTVEEGGARLDDITGGGQVFPDDVYSSKGFEYYGDSTSEASLESYNIIKSVRNKPDEEITIYRAVPKGVTDINEGDWVTLSQKYAQDHAESGYGADGKEAGEVISKVVKVRDVVNDGNDFNEFGYFPETNPTIVGAQKVFQKPTKENPVTAVAPTETEPGIIAFHGSGADFDEFKLEKIGTGEGAQAYGYGLYFTDSEDIAKFYRDTVGGANVLKRAENIKIATPDGGQETAANFSGFRNKFAKYYGDNEALFADRYLGQFTIDPDASEDVLIQRAIDTMNAVKESDKIPDNPKEIISKITLPDRGKIYKVGLEPKVEDLLDYDKTIGNQSEDIKAKISNLVENEITPDDLENFGMPRGDLKASLLSENRSVVSFLNDFAAIRGKDNAGEELLNKYGIKGLKYKAAGSRSAGVDDAAAERNYVIFDDKMIKVLEKYGIVGPVAITGVAASQQGGSETSETM